ncbi:MAG: family 16 glycoside hydrolase [Pirellulaceae bacterium]
MNLTQHVCVQLAFVIVTLLESTATGEDKWDLFIGNWAFELPDGNPAWLQLVDVDGEPSGSLLWSVGSARPVTEIKLRDGVLLFERKIHWKPFGDSDDGKVIDQPFSARRVGDKLRLTVVQKSLNTGSEEMLELNGIRLPLMPPRPDLSQVQFGDPISLFNGRDLTGWRLTNPKKKNGWRAKNGVLTNESPKVDFSAYGDYGNLRTIRDFEDFRLTIEYNVPSAGNSGIYLRGMYEAQVVDRDSKMQGINGPGAVFGRLTPSKNAGNPGGQWNRYELTLVDRHITVVLNGQQVIQNQPVAGCTGGGISADDTRPGPIFLQGDHTSVQYRNIILRPAIKSSRDSLPRVLLIGDSISIGYTKTVIELLKGKAEVRRVQGNAGHTGMGIERLPKWLDPKNGKWDVIHFNWGLWDLCYRNPESKTQGRRDKVNGQLTHTTEQYRENLQKIIVILKKTDAKLIWATTTPVPAGEAGRKTGDDAKYNRVANEVMKKHGIQINDLYTLMVPHMKTMTVAPGNVHFTDAGSRLLAKQVAKTIEQVLTQESR